MIRHKINDGIVLNVNLKNLELEDLYTLYTKFLEEKTSRRKYGLNTNQITIELNKINICISLWKDSDIDKWLKEVSAEKMSKKLMVYEKLLTK